MRLKPNEDERCTTATTPDEYNATYRSLVSLEPNVMTAVFDGQGADPELLTFVRKARGTEAHKGGALVTPGDAQDTCIKMWLASEIGDAYTKACGDAVAFPKFPELDASTK